MPIGSRLIPWSSRATYVRQLRQALLQSVATALTMSLAGFVLTKELGGSLYHLVVMEMAPFVGMVILPFAPQALRGSSKLRTLRVLLICSAVPAGLLGLVGDPALFAALAALALFFQSMTLPASSGILQANYPEAHRNRILSLIFTQSMLVGIAGRWVVGRLLEWDASLYQYLTPAGALCSLLGLRELLKIRVRDEGSGRGPAQGGAGAPGLSGAAFSWSRTREILKEDRAFRWYERVFAFGALWTQIGSPFFVVYLTKVLDASWAQITVLAVLEPVAGWVSLPWWGRVFDRRRSPFWQRGVLNCFWALWPLGYAWSAVGAAWTGRWAPLYLAVAGQGVADKGSALNWTLGAVHFAPAGGAVAYNGVHLFYCGLRGLSGAALGALLFNLFVPGDPGQHPLFFRTLFLVLGGMTLLATVWMFLLHRRYGARFGPQAVGGARA